MCDEAAGAGCGRIRKDQETLSKEDKTLGCLGWRMPGWPARDAQTGGGHCNWSILCRLLVGILCGAVRLSNGGIDYLQVSIERESQDRGSAWESTVSLSLQFILLWIN